MRLSGKVLLLALAVLVAVVPAATKAIAQTGGGGNIQTADEQLLALANAARAEAGAGRLEWDAALAAAALYHCKRMAAEGPIAHQYRGEPDLAGRAGQAGAHFDLIEENVAVGPSASVIHESGCTRRGTDRIC